MVVRSRWAALVETTPLWLEAGSVSRWSSKVGISPPGKRDQDDESRFPTGRQPGRSRLPDPGRAGMRSGARPSRGWEELPSQNSHNSRDGVNIPRSANLRIVRISFAGLMVPSASWGRARAAILRVLRRVRVASDRAIAPAFRRRGGLGREMGLLGKRSLKIL